MRISDWSSDVCSSDLASTWPRRHSHDQAIPYASRAHRTRRIASCRLWFNRFRQYDRTWRSREGTRGTARRPFAHRRPARSRSHDIRKRPGAPVSHLSILGGRTTRSRQGQSLDQPRSEEHTYEPQSLMRISYDVFFLKKKKTK